MNPENPTSQPLLSDEQIQQLPPTVFQYILDHPDEGDPKHGSFAINVQDTAKVVRAIYEADRSKTASLIQDLRDQLRGKTGFETVPKQVHDEVVERLAAYENTQEPFNGHTQIPWDVVECENKEVLGREVVLDIQSETEDGITHVCEVGPDHSDRARSDAAFIRHACNTYYPMRSRLASFQAAARVAKEALDMADDEIHGLSPGVGNPKVTIESLAQVKMDEAVALLSKELDNTL